MKLGGGRSDLCAAVVQMRPRHNRTSARDIVCMAADIQFIRGVNEPSIPDVNLTRARDGSTGTATFVFPSPSVFEASSELGEITGKMQESLELTMLL